MDELKYVMDELDGFISMNSQVVTILSEDEFGKHLYETDVIPEKGIEELRQLIYKLQQLLGM